MKLADWPGGIFEEMDLGMLRTPFDADVFSPHHEFSMMSCRSRGGVPKSAVCAKKNVYTQ